MEQGNLICETPNCENFAISFGMKGNVKTRSCLEHIASLLAKKMHIFDIEGYEFISNHHDAVLFDERKMQVEKGRANLTVFEASCEADLFDALKAIESVRNNVLLAVECRFEEMKVVATTACEEIKAQLAQVEGELKQFVVSKECKLTPTARLVCSDLSATPKFVRFGLSDSSNSVSAVLSESWSVATEGVQPALAQFLSADKSIAVDAALKEAEELAQKGIPVALQYADSLLGDETLFKEKKGIVLSELLKFEKKQIERKLECLQRSWSLRQRYAFSDKATIDVGQQLATLVSLQFGLFSEAEQMLQYCSSLAYKQDPQSRDSMSLCTNACGVYFASAQFQQVELFGAQVLEAFSTVCLPAEYYWATLLYLTYSKEKLAKRNEATVLIEEWQKRQLSEGSRLADMLRFLTCGIEAYYRENKEEAQDCLLQAQRIGIRHFPTSLFTAIALAFLGLLHEDTAREQYCQQALTIYEVVAPKSTLAAENYFNLGSLHFSMGSWAEAEWSFRQAQSICDVVAPKSFIAALTLGSLGLLNFKVKRVEEAEECYRQAQAIFEGVAPKSLEAAGNFKNLGTLLCFNKRWSEGEESYRSAQSIYEVVAPKSIEAAQNHNGLGSALENSNRWTEAEENYRKAHTIFEVAAPKSTHQASNLSSLGNALKKLNRMSEAEECFRQVQSIYEVIDPKCLSAGLNFRDLGRLLDEMQRWQEAEVCFGQAHSILEATCPQSATVAVNLSRMGTLYIRMQQWSEAEDCCKQAQSIFEAVAPKSVAF